MECQAKQIMLPLAVLYSMTMVGSIGGGGFPCILSGKDISLMMAG